MGRSLLHEQNWESQSELSIVKWAYLKVKGSMYVSWGCYRNLRSLLDYREWSILALNAQDSRKCASYWKL